MTEMNDEPLEQDEEMNKDTVEEPAEVPPGIARLHDEWQKQGLLSQDDSEQLTVGIEPVVFPEPVGDYNVPASEARLLLGLSEDAMGRLLEGGELDSILVQSEEGVRRMVSQAALARFLEDSGMSPELKERMASSGQEIASDLQSLREEIREMKELHARQLQQFKDVLLIELRNLKEQDRDLTSFIYDLASALEELNPKLKKRKRTTQQKDSDK
jgi:hypothetical protein